MSTTLFIPKKGLLISESSESSETIEETPCPAIYVDLPCLCISVEKENSVCWTEDEICATINNYKLGRIRRVELKTHEFGQEAIIYFHSWNKQNKMAEELCSGIRQKVKALYGTEFLLFRH